VSPNELSFASITSWKAIYGQKTHGEPVATKNEFYAMYGSAHKTGCIGSERDPQTHSRMKRTLTSAFSTRALTEQEPVINKCVDEFMDKIGSLKEARERGLDMTHWFEMVAFGWLFDHGQCS
jgi:cytochrome P450